MACIFRSGVVRFYGSFQGLRELFSIPFPKDRTIHRKTFDLLRLAWVTVARILHRFRQVWARLQPLLHSGLNNCPIRQENEEKHSVDWSYLKATAIRGEKYGRRGFNGASFVNGKHDSVS